MSHKTDHGETYSFRLFATTISHEPKAPSSLAHPQPSGPPSARHANEEKAQEESHDPIHPQRQIQQIRLTTPPEVSLNDGRTTQKRPLSYYLAASPTASERSQYADAAVSGDFVRRLAKRPCPGLRLAWRVVSLPASSAPAFSRESTAAKGVGVVDVSSDRRKDGVADVVSERRSKKSRTGKKSRLKIRLKMQAKLEGERAKKEATAIKEEKIKERNKRRNREKQLKRRQKGREQREAEAAALA